MNTPEKRQEAMRLITIFAVACLTLASMMA
jgi:hypothetical protein